MTAPIIEENSILNTKKPAGWTSYDVVKKIKKLTRIKKVGHAGTLDPFATGVLLVALGKATKQIPGLMDLKKEYIGEVDLSYVTDTLDPTGKVVKTCSLETIDEEMISAVCQQFIGEIEQVPPAFSALKVNGVRAYKLARQGRAVSLKPRKVILHSLEILEFALPIIKIKVVCSKGTYIRALARDIGTSLNTGGMLKSLVRTRIGDYLLKDSLTMDEIENIVRKQV